MPDRKLLTALIGCVLGSLPGLACAQDAAPLTAMSANPCGAPLPSMPLAMRQTMLQPGAKPLVVPPEAMAAYRKQQETARTQDYANLCRYQSDNDQVAQAGRPRVVFMGDSITETWGIGDPALFSAGVIDRGISGQTTPQMLLRFYQDVVALHPQVVHIMAGVNDLAGNTGPSTVADYQNNIRAMVDLARANGIGVIIASILPTDHFAMQPSYRPAAAVRDLNPWLRQLAHDRGLIYADYYPALVSPTGGLRSEYTNDGLHPTTAGFAAMRPIADAALREALAMPRHGSR